MRKIREVLRLKFELDLSERQISKSTQVSRSTISDYLRRFAVSGLSWPLSDSVDAQALEAALYVLPMGRPSEKPEPDYAYLQRELRHKGVTLQLLWSEYKCPRHAHSADEKLTKVAGRR